LRKHIDILTRNALFEGITPQELEKLLDCMDSREESYAKGDPILMEGDDVRRVGIVLAGEIQVAREDISGNRSILTHLGQGELFAEVFACAGIRQSPVTVTALTDANILYIGFERVLATCGRRAGSTPI
jgi:CRP-like cAMP-binding protein